jgi:hypothetical protein
MTKTVERLTREQAVILSGFTGIMCCPFSWLHEDVEKRLGHPVWTHQFPSLRQQIVEAYRDDFLSLCPKETPMPGERTNG